MSLNHKTFFSLEAGNKSADGYPMRKKAYSEKLHEQLEMSDKILVMNVDHIGSAKLSQLRKDFRDHARFLMGKNTLIRRVIRNYIRRTGRYEIGNLLKNLHGNCALIFLQGNPTIYEMMRIQNTLVARSRTRKAPRAGDIATNDVVIQPGDTNLEPTQTAFFGAMNIATRINRGQIQIVNRVVLIRRGERVNESHAMLLNKLGMRPFEHALRPVAMYDEGECYSADVVDMLEPGRLSSAMIDGMNQVAAFAFGANTQPNLLTVPHSVARAYSNMIAFGLGGLTQYSWDHLHELRATVELNALSKEVLNDDVMIGHIVDTPSPTGTPTPPPDMFDIFNPFKNSDSEDSESDSDTDTDCDTC